METKTVHASQHSATQHVCKLLGVLLALLLMAITVAGVFIPSVKATVTTSSYSYSSFYSGSYETKVQVQRYNDINSELLNTNRETGAKTYFDTGYRIFHICIAVLLCILTFIMQYTANCLQNNRLFVAHTMFLSGMATIANVVHLVVGYARYERLLTSGYTSEQTTFLGWIPFVVSLILFVAIAAVIYKWPPDRTNTAVQEDPAQSNLDLAILLQYKELLDKGAITEAEFQLAKTKHLHL